MSAIEASSVRVNTLADGTLRLTLDIEPRHALAAFTLFGAPGTPLALAALRTKPEPKEPPRPVLHSQWLAMRCGETDFQQWASTKWSNLAAGIISAGNATDCTAELMRHVLCIDSRAKIDSDPAVYERFNRLIRKPWAEHNRQPA